MVILLTAKSADFLSLWSKNRLVFLHQIPSISWLSSKRAFSRFTDSTADLHSTMANTFVYRASHGADIGLHGIFSHWSGSRYGWSHCNDVSMRCCKTTAACRRGFGVKCRKQNSRLLNHREKKPDKHTIRVPFRKFALLTYHWKKITLTTSQSCLHVSLRRWDVADHGCTMNKVNINCE